MANLLIAGEGCEDCRYVAMIDKNKIFCAARGRNYYWGQYVPCEDYTKDDTERVPDFPEDDGGDITTE